MTAKPTSQNILAIESAVGDGSIALLLADTENPIEGGHGGASRAEKIIGEIENLLRDASVSKTDLDLIAVSIGPGSYSGIRIGMATASGLGDALGVPVVGVSVLEAMASTVDAEKVIAVVPIGKNDVAWQIFETNADGIKIELTAPALDSIAAIADSLNDHPEYPIIGPTHGLESLKVSIAKQRTLIHCGPSLASAIGRLASQGRQSLSDPKPIYMRSAVARSVT